MPSSEDCIIARNEVIEKAITIIMNRECCSRTFAEQYVRKLTDDELAELTGIKRGGAYCCW